MVGPLRNELTEREAAETGLPYTVELCAEEDDRPQVVVGQLRTASLGFTCYYGAVREYVGRRVVLRRGRQVVAASDPPPETSPE